ncbi:hypothetical protein B0H66DRAFT_592588 [Apodospora peruviana]|uniref:Uncharacterized protein n=1 Tax=Apodospora peruviana TaxID=516989 RepID=A0AAE0M3B8_9PEZI|nr:hypothetical protein B0H66DRAFT_592588 [Apodospora peruviana]
MAKDRDSELLGTSQSKRPALNHHDSSSSQLSLQLQQPSQQQQQHRTKSQKHVVGGAGRLHARVPSSKALHKHHASASSAKLNRRQGSPSPERGTGHPLAPTHRRSTSDHKLPRDDLSTTILKKNASHTSLKRNRSQVDVGKKSKSSTNLTRFSPNPAVNKLKAAAAGSRVHFNLGDDGPDDLDDDDDGEGEWVDASASASPLLSRRGSTVSGVQTTDHSMRKDDHPVPSPSHPYQAHPATEHLPSNGAPHSLSKSLRDNTGAHKEYITSRILQRVPSHGAPPKMSTENISARPSSSRAHSPEGGISTLSSTPVLANLIRPGSSGKVELTSRFVGNNSQEEASIPGPSFLSHNRNGTVSQNTAINGNSSAPNRPQSIFKTVVESQAQTHHKAQGKTHARRTSLEEGPMTEDEDDEPGYAAEARARHWGPYGLVRDMNRTQQKLNLQRASSSLESAHTHPLPGMGLGLVPTNPQTVPLMGGSNYDLPRDHRVGKMLERTGMEYLVVRRYQNPVARSLTRLSRITGADKGQRIQSRPGTAHTTHTRGPSTSSTIAMPTSSNNNGQSSRRPIATGRPFASLHSASSSLENDGVAGAASRMHERHGGLSGASLVDGEEDAGTMALLRNLWDKNMDLSASQD